MNQISLTQNQTEELQLNLFSQPWWLDITAPNCWDAATTSHNGKLQAYFPYSIQKRNGFRFICNPPLTPRLGPFLIQSNQKTSKKLSQENHLVEQLVSQLPKYDVFSQSFDVQVKNWLPYHWEGFNHTTGCTYQIDLRKNSEQNLWDNLQSNIRYDIRKASNKERLKIVSNLNISDFINIHEMSFLHQGKTLPYSRDLIHRLHDGCTNNNCSKMYFAIDGRARIHAAIYIVWHNRTAYYLMGGGDPELRKSGATSLCLWKAICDSMIIADRFDFEGSMIRPIEKFFRGFGGKPVDYLKIEKINSFTFNALQSIKRTLFFKPTQC